MRYKKVFIVKFLFETFIKKIMYLWIMAMSPRNIKAASFRVKFREQFNLKAIYVFMHEWMVEEEWATRNDSEWPEIFFGQNESALGGTEVWWN